MFLYNALLHLYPASFRREYGGEMRGLFARRRRQSRGAWATLALWVETIRDIVTNAASVHADLLRQDLAYTARTLRHAPGFAITAVLVTALGIGANTAAFSVADFVLIRPLPYAQADRLVKLWEAPPGYDHMELSPPNYRDWKDMSRLYEGMGAYHGLDVNMVGDGDPEQLRGMAVTSEVLPMLGVRPLIGRLFTASEKQGSDNRTVVISNGLWQQHFGGDSAVLGKRVLLDGKPNVIIGVMPPSFHFPNRDVMLWTQMSAQELDDNERDNNWFDVLARLKPGVSLEQARAELRVIASRLEQRYPAENKKVGAAAYYLRDEISEQSRVMLFALCGAALCVLLIACANLANLLIARSLARRGELDLRAALGAGRERLIRQLVTESLVVAVLGGALGIAIAVASVPLLSRLVPPSLPIAQTPTVDLRILVYAVLLTGLTGIGFGVLPAVRASSKTDLGALREGMRAGGGRRARLRSALVMAEVTASVVLLVSFGLLLRALSHLHTVDPGFKASGVLTAHMELPMPAYATVARREQFYNTVLTRVRTLPGVEHAAFISFLPMTMTGGIWPVALAGQPMVRAEGQVASLRFATPEIFATLDVPLKRGRLLEENDVPGSVSSAVVSESFAQHYWPGQDAIGKRFQFALAERTVVGVVGDVRVRGLARPSEPQVYVSYKQVADSDLIGYAPKDLAIRTAGSPMALTDALRRIVHDADPQQPVSHLRTLDEIVADQTASRAVQLRVLGAFAAIAFLLAAIGMHGLLSYSVTQRRHEIGVRLALGAQQATIVALVMRQGVWLALAGIVPGIAIAYASGRAMQTLLVGVGPADALTFLVVSALCIVMTVSGMLLPVLRAVRVSPATVFRS